MRSTVLLLSLFLLGSCASKTAFEPNQTFDCSPGQIVTIQAGFDDPHATGMEGVDTQHSLVVLVGNNSQEDIIVKTIHVTQVPDEASTYHLDSGWGTFDQTVAEGEEGEFKIRMNGRATRPSVQSEALWRNSIALDVRVILGNGDAYRCRFEMPVH
jgi:hypothetical protein